MTGPERPVGQDEPPPGSHWRSSASEPTAAISSDGPRAAAAGDSTRPLGVPPRPSSLPPPRADVRSPRPAPPSSSSRPVSRPRTARLVLKRVDPWSVFLYAVVASLFVGIAIIVAVGLLYLVLSALGVLSSVNTLIGDVTADPGANAVPSDFLSGGRVMTFAVLIAALDVVLLTVLSTLGALLYNVCASLTGGIAVTLSDRD